MCNMFLTNLFRKLYIAFILAFAMVGCETEFTSNYAGESGTIVIEGWVTNSGEPQRVIVSNSLNTPIDYQDKKGNLIGNARVILSSESQKADTLVFVEGEGNYTTSNIVGIPNETYYLRVEYEDKVFEAESFMPMVPAIDSISFARKRVSKENALLFVPLVNFTDPASDENFYLFRSIFGVRDSASISYYSFYSGPDPWMISLFSDTYINGNSASLNVMEGLPIERYWIDGYFWLNSGDFLTIQMQSLTKEGYEFYKSLINQLNYAAGVFHPTPASPPGNISNGGHGFFGATAVSRCSAIVPNGDKYEN